MKKKMEKIPEHEKIVKMRVLEQLMQEAQDEMGGKIDGLKKVSVMSDSPEGLEQGLDKAKEIVDMAPGMEHEALEGGSDDLDAPMGSPEHEEAEMMDVDSLDAEIGRLMKIRDSLAKKHPGM